MKESTAYFYLLKYILELLSTFWRVENFHTTSTFEKLTFLACTSTFLKVAKSSTFDNTAEMQSGISLFRLQF